MKLFVRFLFAGLLILGVLSLGIPAEAQTAATGAVLGTVTDPHQAAVEGAGVEVRNTGTNEVRTQTTNAAGQYSFPGVIPGVYKISVTLAGFKANTLDNFRIDVNKSYTLDFKMELGQISEVV